MICKKCDREWGRYACPFRSGKYHCPDCKEEVTISLDLITCVCATEMSDKVLDYCLDNEISTHCTDSLAQIENSNNVFAKWLKENGYKFKSKYNSGDVDLIAIMST